MFHPFLMPWRVHCLKSHIQQKSGSVVFGNTSTENWMAWTWRDFRIREFREGLEVTELVRVKKSR